MLIEEVDHVGVESLQGRFRDLPDVFRSAVEAEIDLTFLETELRGDDNFVPNRP